MRQWLPHTLKTRAILILCAVFILSQVASLVLFGQNRDKTIILTEATDLADRIIGIVNLARSFPSEDRKQILTAAETQFLTLFPEIVPLDKQACQDNDFSQRMSDRISAAFSRLPGFSTQVCVRSLERLPFFQADPELRGFDALVSINFPDNKQTTFHAILPEGASLLKDKVIIYIFLVAVLALLLGWFLINRSIVPLERLAKAADKLGTNIDTPPLSEEGSLEVAQAARAFNHMQERLARLIHSQTEMLAAISHDLRSAVTRLQLRAELIQDPQEREGLMRVITDMRLMVQSVLDFVRGYNPQEPLRKIDVTALVESLCDDLKEEGFAVDHACETSSIHLQCRPTALRRGLQNLIDNAIRYGGSALVTLAREKQCLVIRVEDSGPGIAEDQLDKVLQPFYRADRARSDNIPGIGLGLAIANNVVQSLGGRMHLSNKPTGGLSIGIEIPMPTG